MTVFKSVFKIVATFFLLLTLLLGGCVACFKHMDASYPRIREGEAFTTETQWGPVVQSVGPCWSSGRHSNSCWIQREGMAAERVSMQTLPGQMVNVGECLGVTYKISDTVVESYTVRDKWSRTIMSRGECFKSEKDCYWPSKAVE